MNSGVDGKKKECTAFQPSLPILEGLVKKPDDDRLIYLKLFCGRLTVSMRAKSAVLAEIILHDCKVTSKEVENLGVVTYIYSRADQLQLSFRTTSAEQHHEWMRALEYTAHIDRVIKEKYRQLDDTNKLFLKKSSNTKVFITPVCYEYIGDFQVEIGITLNHPNVNSIIDVFHDHTDMVIVSPTVTSTLESITDQIHASTREIMCDVLKGLDYLHKKGISHGNIKLNTIESSSYGKWSIDAYSASSIKHSEYFTRDLFDVGIVFYQLLIGRKAELNDDGEYHIDIKDHMSDDAVELMKGLMHDTISAGQALEHAFFKNS